MTQTIAFVDKAGYSGFVTGIPGTNFGLRITAKTAARLLVEHSMALPFDIMAAGYGDDEDWVGLTPDDLDVASSPNGYGLPLAGVTQLMDPEGWAPFELWAVDTDVFSVLSVPLLPYDPDDDSTKVPERGYRGPVVHADLNKEVLARVAKILGQSDIVWPKYGTTTIADLARAIVKEVLA